MNKVIKMRKGLLYSVAAMLLLTSVLSAVSATNWTMYGYDEANTGFSPDFAPSDANIYLQTQLLENQYLTGAAAVNDILYIGSNGGDVLAVDSADGEIIWQQAVQTVNGVPAVMNGKVYIVNNGDSGGLYCYAADDGEALWNTPTSGKIRCGATASNDRVYLTDDTGVVYCINSNGGIVWQHPTGELMKCTPALYDNKIYVFSSEKVYCLNQANGAEIWQYDPAFLSAAEGAPSVINNKVYVSTKNALLCLDAQGNGGGSTDLLWSYIAQGSSITGITSPALAYGNVYIGLFDGDYENENLVCLNQENGQEVWTHQFEEKVSFAIAATPVIASEKLYIGTGFDFDEPMFEDFFVYCVDALGNGDGTTDVIWQYETDARLIQPACIFDGTVIITGSASTLLGFFTPNMPTIEGPEQGYVNERLEFTAEIDSFAQSGQVQYMFDWGNGEDTYWLPDEDGVPVGEPFTIEYEYDIPGDYEVRVKVRDPEIETESGWVSHMVHITPIRVISVSGGFGVDIQVRNDGVLAKDLHWEVDLIGGQLPGFHLKKHYEGDVTPLEANATTMISTPVMFGLGNFNINIKLEYAGEPTLEETVEGTILFFYVLV